jgi:hypothetical protein
MKDDYIKVYPLDINLYEAKLSCNLLYQHIKHNLSQDNLGIDTGPITTQAFNQYNLLLYPFAEFHKLYQEICRVFSLVDTSEENYYIQCWLNYYEQGQFIDWHSHWAPKDNTWHGFFCVDCEDSVTSYRLPTSEEIDVPSINGNLVISRSAGDVHRTYPWPHSDRPRITVAFDCVPWRNISWGTNHWVPIHRIKNV